MKKILFSGAVLVLTMAIFAGSALADANFLKTRHDTVKNSIGNIR